MPARAVIEATRLRPPCKITLLMGLTDSLQKSRPACLAPTGDNLHLIRTSIAHQKKTVTISSHYHLYEYLAVPLYAFPYIDTSKYVHTSNRRHHIALMSAESIEPDVPVHPQSAHVHCHGIFFMIGERGEVRQRFAQTWSFKLLMFLANVSTPALVGLLMRRHFDAILSHRKSSHSCIYLITKGTCHGNAYEIPIII